jgi:hypothetical protein
LYIKYVFIATQNAYPESIVLYNEISDTITITKTILALRWNIFI